MAYQYAHVETYSLKGSKKRPSARSICAEGERKPENSPHVANPKPPVVLAGVTPMQAYEQIVEAHSEARDTVNQKNGKQALRRMRADAQVLLAAVASYPVPTEECDIESPEFKDWADRAIAFFTEEHGEPLSVVLHTDESHPHIHFLTAPDLVAGERMADIHPGEKAKADVGGKNAKKTEKREAWKDAMRSWQDRYHDTVGAFHAQARLGPQRQRLTRAEWKAQQAELKRQAERLRELERQREQVAQQAQQSQAEIDQQQAEVDAARADLEGAQEAVEAAQAKLDEQRDTLKDTREFLVGKAQEIREARADVRSARAELNQQTDDLGQRLNEVEAEERRLGSLWGKIVSAVTLGRAGTEKRVRDAVEAERERLTNELEQQAERAKKAESRLTATERRYSGEKAKLAHEAAELERRAEAAASAQKAAEAKGQELAGKVEQLEADNRHLAGDREELRELLNAIEDAASTGDLDTVQDLLAGDSSPGEGRGMGL